MNPIYDGVSVCSLQRQTHGIDLNLLRLSKKYFISIQKHTHTHTHTIFITKDNIPAMSGRTSGFIE